LYEFVQIFAKKRFASGLGFQPGTKIACNRRSATPSTTPPPPLVPILFIYRTIRLPSEKWDCTNSSVWHIVIPFLYEFIQTNSYSCYTNCLVRIRTRCGFCTNSYSFYTNCIVWIHTTSRKRGEAHLLPRPGRTRLPRPLGYTRLPRPVRVRLLPRPLGYTRMPRL
jgi:hypothetical protein